MLRKIMVITMSAMMAISLAACTNGKNESKETTKGTATTVAETATTSGETAESDFKAADVSKAGWKMTVDNVQISSELSNTSEVLGYSSASSSTFEQKADEGKVYVMIKMTITKDGASENLKWNKMILTDADGNTYNRIEDSFIDSLTWKRMSGTDLNFGSNEGWFAYEIPENKSESGLTLSYKFSDETMEYKVN